MSLVWQQIFIKKQLPVIACNHGNAGFPGGTSGKEPTCQRRRHKTWVQSLGQEESLEEGFATHSCMLAWRIPWTEETGRLYSPWGRKESNMTEATYLVHMHGDAQSAL